MKPTEEKVLNYIKKYHEKHSLMPTVREICKGLGFKSTSSVSYHLAHLVEKGELTNLPNKSRAYRLANDNTLSFKAKWDRLKDWISNSAEVLLYSISDKPAKIGNKRYNYFERKQLLDKINELENGE